MKILITGGAGFVGQNLIKKLKTKFPECDITVIDIKPNPYPRYNIEELGAKVFYGPDITKPETIEEFFIGKDYIFHLAGLISFWKKEKDLLHQINVEAVGSIVDLCLKYNIKKLIHISSVASLGYRNDKDKPINEDFDFPFHTAPKKYYMQTKRKGHEIVLKAVKERGLRAVIICPALMWGAGDFFNTAHLIEGINDKKIFVNMPGGTYIADVEDVARGIVSTFEKGRIGEVYILGGYNYPFKESNAIVARALNISPPKVDIPMFLHKPMYFIFRIIEIFSKGPLPIYSDTIDSGFMFRYFDNSKSNKELGWVVEKPFSQTVSEQIEYLKKYKLLKN